MIYHKAQDIKKKLMFLTIVSASRSIARRPRRPFLDPRLHRWISEGKRATRNVTGWTDLEAFPDAPRQRD